MEKLPEILTNEEVKRFLNTFNQEVPTGFRNYGLFYLLFKTGMRISEALDMKYEDLNKVEDEMTAEGYRVYYRLRKSKNKTQADIFIPIKVYKIIIKISELFEHNWKGYVFTSIRKKENSHLQARYCRELAKRKGLEANLSKDMHPHLTRHYFLSTIYNKTKDIRLVQSLARHKDIKTTVIYTKIAPTAGVEAVKYIDID